MPEEQNQRTSVARFDYGAEEGRELGLPSPNALALLDDFSKKMASSVFLPKGISGHPANILGIILTGREMGMGVMASLRALWVSPDGRVAMYANTMMARMRASGFKFSNVQASNEAVEMTCTRPDGESYTASFTMADALRAGLAGKDPWRKYPKSMMTARVTSDIFRFLGADLASGNLHIPEEIDHSDDEPPTNMEPEPPAPEIKTGRRKKAQESPAVIEAQVVDSTAVETGPAEQQADVAPTTGPEPDPAPVQAKTENRVPTPSDSEADQEAADVAFVRGLYDGMVKRVSPNAPKTASTIINTFVCAYLGIASRPNNPLDYKEPLLAMLKMMDVSEEDVRKNPTAAALKAKRSGGPLEKYFAKSPWTEPTKLAARGVLAAYKLEELEFIEWLETLGVESLLDEDLFAFFALAKHTRNAYMVMDISRDSGTSIHSIIGAILDDGETDNKILDQRIQEQEKKLVKNAKSPAKTTGQADLPWN